MLPSYDARLNLNDYDHLSKEQSAYSIRAIKDKGPLTKRPFALRSIDCLATNH
jgi:hypothetical protein